MNITQEQIKEKLKYDPETGVFVWNSHSVQSRVGSVAGCKYTTNSGNTYIRIRVGNQTLQAHRLAFLYIEGFLLDPNIEVDHINGDGTDNRFNNLRKVTRIENSRNAKLNIRNNSGSCGVSFHKKTNGWYSYIMIEGKSKNLGVYASKEDAIKARKNAEIEYGFHKNHGSARIRFDKGMGILCK